MAETEYAKRDTNHTLEVRNIRLAADAKAVGSTHKVTFVLTSKADKAIDMWVDAFPSENDALARYLKKGDVLSATGFLEASTWGDDGAKVQFTLRFARLHYPFDLLKALQERASAGETKTARKRSGRAAPTGDDGLTSDIPF